MTVSLNYLIIIVGLYLRQAHGNVRLTFPPARTYALDFLNNANSDAPCGFKPYEGVAQLQLFLMFHTIRTLFSDYTRDGIDYDVISFVVMVTAFSQYLNNLENHQKFGIVIFRFRRLSSTFFIIK